MKHRYVYNTSIGNVLIEENGASITKITLVDNGNEIKDIAETDLTKQAFLELNEYLEGKRMNFHIKLEPEGTDFQKKVWNALTHIPYGETRSYKEIAKAIGNEKASRAVGMANNKNPILIAIPCHRVIGANGKLIGYACGLEMKEHFLKMEREIIITNK